MKKSQHSSFKFSPVALAVALALTSQFAANVAQAGAGYGSGLTSANAPVAVQTYYANSPSGPIPTYTGTATKTGSSVQADMQRRTDGSELPVKVSSGKALRKFVDPLPVIPAAVAEKWVDLNGVTTNDDYYEIAAVEYTQRMHSDLPKATRLRGYVQLMTPGLLANRVNAVPFTTLDGQVLSVVAAPNHLGPIINARKGTAVRVKFTNLLPKGTTANPTAGNLFLPVDPTIAGAGVGPDGVTFYTQNRTNLHLVGGEAPWISAGTPHQWIAPAGEKNPATDATGLAIPGGVADARGVSNKNVPDMADPGPGSSTYYFPNDLSARFTFIQDRTSGLSRLNAYAGLEAGYVISDAAEATLIANGKIPGAADTIPLIIEDKTFVPSNVAQQDAKWDSVNWGQPGDLWFPHVYEPNQDPNSITGANPVGRWDYGPLFWPIFPSMRGELPTVSATPEAYLDTPVINGVAYPTLTVDPKAYRLRILNASNDRYINLGLYKADGSVSAPQLDQNGNPIVDAAGNQMFFTNTEVKMVPAAPDARGNPPGWNATAGVQGPAPQYPNLPWHINAEQSGPTRAWPTDGRAGGAPDPTMTGPDFVVIGNDGGLIPNPVDIPSQPVTYETNRRSITVLSIYGYGMLLGPAERADTVVDFSQYAGETLILYNDAPAPTPFIDPRNDYYTGNPDLSSQGGAYPTQPGYGPNTRTMMQIRVSGTKGQNGTAYNADALKTALPAAYASSNPPIVPAVAYNAAFGTNDADVVAHVATGSSAQPKLDYTTTGQLTITGLNLITSGGTGAFGNVVGSNAVPGSGSGYLVAPLVSIVGGGGTGATATAVVDNVPNAANNFVPTYQVTGITNFVAGNGYTSAPSVLFIPQPALTSVILTNAGTGFTSPVVNIDPPSVASGRQATATATVTASSPISATVRVNRSGSGYAAPVVTFVPNGPGTGAAGYATITSSALTAGAGGVTVTAKGSGYTAPTARFTTNTGNPGTGAAATVQFSQSVSLPASGLTITGFAQGSTLVTIGAPTAANGARAIATANFDANGAIVGFTMADSGSGYTTPPTVTIRNTATNKVTTLPASFAAGSGVVTGVTITNVGSGYTQVPTLNIVDPTGTGATATVTLANNRAGRVSGITITNTGSGYTTAPTLVLTDGGVVNASAVATITLSKAIGSIASVTITDPGAGYTTAPRISILDANAGPGRGASATAGMVTSGVGAQASVKTTNTKSILVGTKAEQELFDDYGRYNSTGGVEIPLVNGVVQTTIPLNYIDSATEIFSDVSLNDQNVQVWKIVDNGFWSNSMHFDMVDVQLINRVGWDGTVKMPASNELGWKDTLRLNPLEDVIVAMRAKPAKVPFGQPQSKRLLDPSKPINTTATHPTAPTLPIPGVTYASGLGFTGAQAAGLAVGVATKNELRTFDNEFTWGSQILGHADNDFRRPVIFNPTVAKPDAPTNLVDPLNTGEKLTWTDPTPSQAAATLANPKNELGFKIVKAATVVNGVPGAFDMVVATLPANATSWTNAAVGTSGVAYAVVAYNALFDSALSNAVINAAPPAPSCTIASAFDPNASNAAGQSITLNCSDTANNVTTFLVTRTEGTGVSSVTGSPVSITAVIASGQSAFTYPDTNGLVGDTTYSYVITATNRFGTSSATTVGLATSSTVLEAPTGLAATAVLAACPTGVQSPCKPADVKLTWTDKALNETGYTITRTGGTGRFTPVNLPGTLNIKTPTMSYVDTTAAENVTYEYTVTATNGTASMDVKLSYSLPVTVPTIPTALVVTPTASPLVNGAYPGTAVLTWTDNAFNETGYTVYRAATAPASMVSPATLVTTLSANGSNNPLGSATTGWVKPNPTMSYTDTNLADGVTYAYTVSADNGTASKSSAPSTVVMPGVVIATPTNLVATPDTTGSSIALSWTDNANNERDYMVEERVSTNNGVTYSAWANVGTATAGGQVGATVTFTRTIALPQVASYAYRVSARRLPSQSAYAETTVQTNPSAPAVPGAPANLRVSAQTLSWAAATGVPANATVTYTVEKSVDGGSTWVSLTPTPTAARTLAVLSPDGINYQYRVAAQVTRGTLVSAWSAWTTTPFNTVPAASTTPVAKLVTARNISVSWTNVSTNITGFTVQRRLGGGAWTNITPAPAVTAASTSYSIIDTVALPGSYTYRLLATSAGGSTANTATSNAVVTP